MAKELSEDTALNISVKTLGGIAFLIATLVGMWFTLQNDIAEARELPIAPDPVITRMEFDMKDKLIRQTIMNTQEDVSEIKEDMKLIKQKLYE
jgi:hypothetical protein|tara:strand:- start:1252 stop:1530 length:279 start_codon:yes stop_codon:yes gene_type:complete